MHNNSNAVATLKSNKSISKAQTPAHEVGYRIPINVKLNAQSIVQQPGNILMGKGSAATGPPNFTTSMFKPISASASVNSDVMNRSNLSAFEANSAARRKREAKLTGKQMLATRFEKMNYHSENNDHGESLNESSSMSLRALSNNQMQQQAKIQANVAPPASPAPQAMVMGNDSPSAKQQPPMQTPMTLA